MAYTEGVFTEEELEELAESIAGGPRGYEDTGFFPTISIQTEVGSDGLITADSLKIVWYPYSVGIYYDDGAAQHSLPDRVEDFDYAAGDFAIWKEMIEDSGEIWNSYSNVGDPSDLTITESGTDTTTKTFDITYPDAEITKLDAKYNKSDYTLDEMTGTDNVISGSFTPFILSAISSSYRLESKYAFRKVKTAPFKAANMCALGATGSTTTTTTGTSTGGGSY
jgi:hypothetical protein